MTNSIVSDATELTVSIKSGDSTFKKKFLLYENYYLNSQDPVVKRCIETCLAEINVKYEDDDMEVKIRAFLQI